MQLTAPTSNHRKTTRLFTLFLGLCLVIGACLFYGWLHTESAIEQQRQRVVQLARRHPAPPLDQMAIAQLPSPVQRYFRFVFRRAAPSFHLVRMTMTGDFRRPQCTAFTNTSSQQTTAIGEPALVFSATTTLFPGFWARASDSYIAGNMEMRVKLMGLIAVVDQPDSPKLNESSLRRWLMESPLYPTALLPGGPVRWEALDHNHARAIVTAAGRETSLIARFREDGSLASFYAEEDGDLSTPYHGAGEQAERSNYRLVSGLMLPFDFVISRVARGQVHPFWRGRITSIRFE